MHRCSHRPLPRAARARTSLLDLLDSRLLSCEARRDLVFARAREPLNERNRQRGAPNRHFETPQAGSRTRRGARLHRCRSQTPPRTCKGCSGFSTIAKLEKLARDLSSAAVVFLKLVPGRNRLCHATEDQRPTENHGEAQYEHEKCGSGKDQQVER